MIPKPPTALDLGPIGYGSMSIAGVYGHIDEASALDLLRRLADAGIRHIDTANIYGDGLSETLVGRFLAGRDRDSIFIASKTGLAMGEQAQARAISGRPETIYRNIDETLRRLSTDYVDLYYQHRIDPDVPVEETAGALGELVHAGKVRYAGLSEASSTDLRRAHSEFPIAAVQTEWNIFSRDVEEFVVPAASELGVAMVAYSPVSRGLLTDDFDSDAASHDMRKTFPRFYPENIEANLALVEVVRSVARRHGRATEQVALAWLLAKGREFGASVSIIPGTRSLAHLRSNLGALTIELSPDDIEELDAIATRVRGDRVQRMHTVSAGREKLSELPEEQYR